MLNFLIPFALASVSAVPLQSTVNAVPDGAQLVQRISGFDLDGDGRSDSIDLYCATDEYCNGDTWFDVAKLGLSASGTHVVRSEAGWAQFEPAVPLNEPFFDPAVFPKPNLLASPFAYAHRFGPAGTLLFLFGQPEGGSSGPGVTVLAVSRGGIRKYFEPYEFYPTEFIAPASAGRPWRMAAALSTSQPFTDESLPDAELWTYNPVTVFILGRTIAIDDAATERRARKQYGAYAGPKPSEDVVEVREKTGKRYLVHWPSRKAVK